MLQVKQGWVTLFPHFCFIDWCHKKNTYFGYFNHSRGCDYVQCVGTITHFIRQHAVCSGSVRLWRVRGCRVQLCWSPRWLQSDPPPAPGGSRAAGDTGTVWSRWWQSIVQDTWWSPSRTASGNTSASDRPCRSLSSLCRSGCSGRTGTSDGTETTTVKVYNTSWTRGVSSMDVL